MLEFERFNDGFSGENCERFVMYAKDWATERESKAIDVTF